MHQQEHRRYVLHLLNATTITRGGGATTLHGDNVSGSQSTYEVIEEINLLHNIGIDLQLDQPVHSVRAEPEGVDLPFTIENGRLHLTLPTLGHHQMIVIGYQSNQDTHLLVEKDDCPSLVRVGGVTAEFRRQTQTGLEGTASYESQTPSFSWS